MTDVVYRVATIADVPAMAECRLVDAGAVDDRMGKYFEGTHHPQKALPQRTGCVALVDSRVIGYVAGHLTRRYGCHGELQYLFVKSPWRRAGVGRELVRRLAQWFVGLSALNVCVNVDCDSESARPFYLSLGATDLRPHWMEWVDITTVARI